MAFIHSPKIVTDGLVLYLDAGNRRSYPGSGTTWVDLSGNLYSGSLTNGPTFDGANGGSINFDGSNDYVSCSTDLLQDTGGLFASASLAWTVSAWFRPNTVTRTNSAIVSLAGGIGTGATFTTYTSASITNIRLRGGTVRAISGLTADWHELTITWDGTTARAYYDGSFSNNVSVGTAARQSRQFLLGNNSDLGEPFAGKIANTKVYNRALSATEILQNYNATRSRFGV